jgi:hypothetical protein
MTPRQARDRDAGMRRISSTTRWVAGAGFVLTGAFAGFFAGRANSSAQPVAATPAAGPAATSPAPDTASQGSTNAQGSGSAAALPSDTLPPDTLPPRHYHSATRGS